MVQGICRHRGCFELMYWPELEYIKLPDGKHPPIQYVYCQKHVGEILQGKLKV